MNYNVFNDNKKPMIFNNNSTSKWIKITSGETKDVLIENKLKEKGNKCLKQGYLFEDGID